MVIGIQFLCIILCVRTNYFRTRGRCNFTFFGKAEEEISPKVNIKQKNKNIYLTLKFKDIIII